MLHPSSLLQVTFLSPLSVSACQILVSRDSCERITSPTTMPQLCRRVRQSLPVGATGACPLGSVTGFPRMNLVLGARMLFLPANLDSEAAVNFGHRATETELHERGLHQLAKMFSYPEA